MNLHATLKDIAERSIKHKSNDDGKTKFLQKVLSGRQYTTR